MSFTVGQPYVIKVPMQLYWDSDEALARNDTHNSDILQPSTVYIAPAYRDSYLPAIPVRTAPYPNGYDLGWLNINENALPAWIGTSSGNKQILTMTVGTTSGNKQVKAAWIGTSSGNKKIF